MTSPTTPAPITPLARRQQFLQTLVLRNGTVADAENINEIQARVETALQEFGGEVDFTVDQLVLILSAFTAALRREQAAYKADLDARFVAFTTKVEQDLAALRQAFAAADEEKYKEMKAYVDALMVEQREVLRESTKTSLGVTTPEMADDGIFDAGKDFPVTVATVPVGHTFKVHRWTYSHQTISGIGGLQDRLRVTWPGFLGYEDFSSNAAAAQRDSGAFAETPIATLPAGTVVRATVYVGNIKTQCTFALEGYLVPDALENP